LKFSAKIRPRRLTHCATSAAFNPPTAQAAGAIQRSNLPASKWRRRH